MGGDEAKSALDEFMNEGSCGLIRMSEVEAHPPEFLWWPFLRLGNLNLLRGNGGSGKTSLTFALAAAISKGVQPMGMPGRLNIDGPGVTIYLGSEDDLPEYKTMLDANGANSNHILLPTSRIPTLGEISTIEKMIRTYKATMLVIDPVQALLPDGVDMNRSNEIRPLLDGLRTVCRQTGCTVLVLEHLNKSTKSANVFRGSGSMDFYNAARSVLITGWTSEGQRACGHLKSNGAAYGPAILFDIADGGRLIWRGGDSTIDGEDIETARARVAPPDAPNPNGLLARKLVEEHGFWEGTANEGVTRAPEFGLNEVFSAEAFGRFIKKGENLKPYGVTARRRRANRGAVYSLEVLQRDGGDGDGN